MQRKLKRRLIVCGAMMMLLSASTLLAKQAIVKTHDGRSFEGDVTEKPTNVVIVVRGISTTINRDDIESVTYVGGIEQQYQDRVARLPKTPSAPARVEIAKWLFDNHAYDLALKELVEAGKIDPNNADAATLEQTIMSQKRLDRSGPAKPTSTTGTGGTATNPPRTVEGGHTANERKYITADDINTIRQAEWPKDDSSVRATVAPDIRKKYIAYAGEKAPAFNALPPAEQARAILSSDVKELRKEVKILNDPAPLAEYRKTVQPMILKGCATVGCHGGPQGGRFFLYSPAENDQATYTNFFLLTQQAMLVGGAQHTMIDRTYPENSLLMELGLPSEISKVAHPLVAGATIRPIFRGKDDPNYRVAINWMSKSLVLIPGAYGVSFSLDAPATPPVGPKGTPIVPKPSPATPVPKAP